MTLREEPGPKVSKPAPGSSPHTPKGGPIMASSLTPEQRRLRGRLGAAISWANTGDRSARTAKARAGFDAMFERQVDPDGTLDPAERAERAEQARKAHFLQLAWKASRARSKAKQARERAAELDAEALDADAELAVQREGGSPAA